MVTRYNREFRDVSPNTSSFHDRDAIATGTGWLNRLLLLFTGFMISVAFCPPLYCEDNDQSLRTAPPIGVRGESEGRRTVAGEVSDMRSLLEKRGIHLAFTYRGEVFLGVRLDPEGIARYRHLAELALDIDTEKLNLWPGGKFFLRGQNGKGQTINITPGGIAQPISNIDARDFTEVSQYGLTQTFFGGVIRIDAGKRDVNAIFCVNRDANHFINPVFTLIPTVPMPTFPKDALGVAVFVEPVKKLTFGLGTYNGVPKIGGLGFDALPDNKGQYFSVFETHFAPPLGPDGLLHGSYRLGIWYMSGPSQGTGGGIPEIFHGNYGVYALINQLIYKRSKNQTGPELDAFMQFGWAPDDRNAQTAYVSLGAVYKGFGNGRHTMGMAVGRTWIMAVEPAGQRTHLTNLELFYRIEAASWLHIQPDVQYFDNVDAAHRNGLAVGIRSTVHF